jgi:proline iminopeptidase
MSDNSSSAADDQDWKYPLPSAPKKDGQLKVGDQHEVYWHEYGNRNGAPVMFLHGGPGGGTEPKNARFFNPRRYRIILFDQRGCGKSQPNAGRNPLAALQDNTTCHLIEDIQALRKELNIEDPMHVFGGSWGSTLAMAYTIEHPDNVKTLILRGIFLCRRQDLNYFYQGNAENYDKSPHDSRLPGTYLFYPEAWKKFVEVIDAINRRDMVKAYAEIFADHTVSIAT